MDPDDALIDLLNGFSPLRGFKGAGNAEKPFLDEAGVPTDVFLQALKHDFTSFSFGGDRERDVSQRGSVRRQSTSPLMDSRHKASGDADTGSSSEGEGDEDLYSSSSEEEEEEEEPPAALRKRSQSSSGGAHQNQFSRTDKITGSSVGQRPQYRGSKKPSYPAPKAREGGGQDKKHIVAKPALKEKEKPRRQKRPTRSTDEIRISDGFQAPLSRNVVVTHSVAADDYAPSAGRNGHPATAFPPDDDEQDFKMESDLKVKSLQLRVTGQLRTIRVLETQLADAQHSLKASSLLVAQGEVRLKQLEPKDRDRGTLCGKAKAKEEAKQLSVRADDNIERYKAQVELLQGQVAEEQARRQRAEERSKALKTYVDKAKTQCREEEGFNKDLKGSLEGLQAKVLRYKRDCREYATEALSQRTLAAERAVEAGRERGRADQAETHLRHAHMDVEKLRDDVRTQKLETANAQKRMKSVQQELELLKEREAAQRAAQRLKSLGGDQAQAKGADTAGTQEKSSSHNNRRSADDRLRNSYLATDDEDDRSSSHRDPADTQPLTVEAKDKYPRSRPLLSATHPRRPHYTLPSTRSSHSELGATGAMAHPGDRDSYSSEHKIGLGRPGNPLESSSSRSSIRGHAGEPDDHQSQQPELKGNLRPPPSSTTSLHFSDSELQHYRKHSTGPQSLSSSIEGLSRRRTVTAQDAHPPRPPPSHVKRFSNPDDSTAVLGSSSRGKAGPPNIRISFDGDRGDSVRDSISRPPPNPTGGDDSSLMQKRAEQLLDTDLSGFAAQDVPVAPPADVARFGRLQNMYERLTGKGAPTSWRDSESSDSD